MVYGYIRVSTDKQDCNNQKIGIQAKAKSLGLVIDKYIKDDGISGTRDPDKRALGNLILKLKPKDIIICGELSRLGRNMFMVMRILENIMKSGTKLYSVKDNYELGDNIQSKVLAFAFGLAAEIERDMISQRTREALVRKKTLGVKLGRPNGHQNKNHKTDGKADVIKTLLTSGIPKLEIARQLKISPKTLYRAISRENI